MALLILGLPCVLFLGFRLPVGRFGVSMLSDPGGRPYVVIDHSSTRGWLLAYDRRHRRVEAWGGTVLVQ